MHLVSLRKTSVTTMDTYIVDIICSSCHNTAFVQHRLHHRCRDARTLQSLWLSPVSGRRSDLEKKLPPWSRRFQGPLSWSDHHAWSILTNRSPSNGPSLLLRESVTTDRIVDRRHAPPCAALSSFVAPVEHDPHLHGDLHTVFKSNLTKALIPLVRIIAHGSNNWSIKIMYARNTDDTGGTIFGNGVQSKPTSRGMTTGAPPQTATPATPDPGDTLPSTVSLSLCHHGYNSGPLSYLWGAQVTRVRHVLCSYL
jgi:hypothetical protein